MIQKAEKWSRFSYFFDACYSCLLQVHVAYPLLCTESISWLEPWPEQSKSSYHPKMNFDIYREDYIVFFHHIFVALSK